MREAQRLMPHNLQSTARGGCAGPGHRYSYRQLGPVRRRVDEAERLLAMLLSQHFFVEHLDPQATTSSAASAAARSRSAARRKI